MKKVNVILFAVMTVLFMYSALALAGQRIINGMSVNGFIGGIQQSDKFFQNAKIIEARGYIADWADAIAGEGTILGDDGNIHIVKIYSVPFCDSTGIRRASIIGGILKFQSRAEVHEFITIADDIDRTTISGGGNTGGGQDVAIEPLIRAIRDHDRSGIWTIILNGGIPSTSIRVAFETNGIECSSAPIWFPEKSIWYAATCIRSIQAKGN